MDSTLHFPSCKIDVHVGFIPNDMFFTSKHEKLLNLEGTVGVPKMVEKKM